MKGLKTFLLITILLVTGATIDAAAQNRNARTASARAAYGLPGEKYKSKAPKKKKKYKVNTRAIPKKNKEVKRRKRDSWAS